MTEIIPVPLDPEIKKVRDESIANEYEAACQFVTLQRRTAYTQESDPIFFQAQRNETYTMDDWKAKVSEIDARFPYPEEPS